MKKNTFFSNRTTVHYNKTGISAPKTEQSPVEKTGQQSFSAVLWTHANTKTRSDCSYPNSQILLFMAIRMSGIFAPGCC